VVVVCCAGAGALPTVTVFVVAPHPPSNSPRVSAVAAGKIDLLIASMVFATRPPLPRLGDRGAP
jgi:hypothetical protein